MLQEMVVVMCPPPSPPLSQRSICFNVVYKKWGGCHGSVDIAIVYDGLLLYNNESNPLKIT